MHLNGSVKDTHHHSDNDDDDNDDNDDDDDEEEEEEEEEEEDNEDDDDTFEKDTNYSSDIPHIRSEQHLNLEHGLHEKQMNELQGLHETSEEKKYKYIAEELTENVKCYQVHTEDINDESKGKIEHRKNEDIALKTKEECELRPNHDEILQLKSAQKEDHNNENGEEASLTSEVNTELPILFFECAYIYNCGQYARFVLVKPSDCALDWCKSNLKALDILHNPFFQYNPTTRQVKSTSKSNNGKKLLYLDFLIVGNINLHMFSPLPNWDKVTKLRRAGRDPIIGILWKKTK
ncbi:unnamed protein product [Mytilus coruscus]|uniref:Uncharacterized protein n=1 Tax=Mytilus coruscus TaxID=42192 RepID=A0A6J8CY82_MYTCO|nr:unnamed protein product [Mytilus coruscus]